MKEIANGSNWEKYLYRQDLADSTNQKINEYLVLMNDKYYYLTSIALDKNIELYKLGDNIEIMTEKIPWILNGEFNIFYDEVSNKQEVEQYNEVDLGELNFSTQRSKTKGEKNAGTHTDIENKTYNYHLDNGLIFETIRLLKELKIGAYSSIDQVIDDHNNLFPQLLNTGYFLKGTKAACLLKSIIPPIDHLDFEYFFVAKLYLVSKKLSRIDKFLDFQLQSFITDGKSAIDFTRFVRLVLRQYAEEFEFTKQALETIEEWVTNPASTSLEGTSSNDQNSEIQWNGSKADLIKFVYASYYAKYINSGQGSIIEYTRKILNFFNLKFNENDTSLSSAISLAKKNGHNQHRFAIRLQIGFRKYLSTLQSMKGHKK